MPEERVVGSTRIRLEKGDCTDQETDAFVYYAQHDLKLGSGWGTAIAGRGGPAVQKELDALGPIETCDAVITGAGNMKAKHIIHAVGPRFQEKDTEGKLRRTVENTLRLADENGLRSLVLPPMGAGFYGIPLEMCSEVMIETIRKHASGGTRLEEVVIVVNDQREYAPFEARFKNIG